MEQLKSFSLLHIKKGPALANSERQYHRACFFKYTLIKNQIINHEAKRWVIHLGFFGEAGLWEILKTKTSEMGFLEIWASHSFAVLLTFQDLAILRPSSGVGIFICDEVCGPCPPRLHHVYAWVTSDPFVSRYFKVNLGTNYIFGFSDTNDN